MDALKDGIMKVSSSGREMMLFYKLCICGYIDRVHILFSARKREEYLVISKRVKALSVLFQTFAQKWAELFSASIAILKTSLKIIIIKRDD